MIRSLGRCALLGIALAHSAADAQARSDSGTTTWDIVPYVGIATRSPVGYDWGATADRSHLFVGVHLRTPVVRLARAQLFYAPTLTPFLRLAHHRTSGSTEPQQPTAYAVGFAPFGLAVGLPVSNRVRAFASTAVGALWFDRVVPVPDARAFNVSLEWGGSLEWTRSATSTIEIGYRFHHMSNVYTAAENPGVDANLFFVGHRWRRTVQR